MFPSTRGHNRPKRRLQAFIAGDRVPSALLFHGLEGVGKSLLAREFAAALSSGTDIKLVDAAYQASLREEEVGKQRTLRVDTIRHLRRDMELKSLLGGWKVAIVDEAQNLEPEASNALLKILEEPPEKTLWILISPSKERLLRTVVSRCFSIPFSPLATSDVAALLRERGIPERFAELAEGSVGRAIKLAELGDPDEAALPKELYAQRTYVELALFSYGQKARQRLLAGEADSAKLFEIDQLRRALRANVDPRSILSLAKLRA